MNKVSTVAQLRFNVRGSPSLPEEVKARLEMLAGSRMTTEGILVIDARRYRTQEQNRADAIARLVSLIQQAMENPGRARKPGQGSRHRRAGWTKSAIIRNIKRMRRYPPGERE